MSWKDPVARFWHRQPPNSILLDCADPHRNPMPPPKLPADAPIADVFVPCLVGLGIPLGDDAHLTLPALTPALSRSTGRGGRSNGTQRHPRQRVFRDVRSLDCPQIRPRRDLLL